MKTKKKRTINVKTIIMVLVLPLFAAQCEKEEIPTPPETLQLPLITQTGEHTFGCLLNDEVWVPRHYSNSVVNPPVVLQGDLDRSYNNLFSITAWHKRKDNDSQDELIALYAYEQNFSDTIFFDLSDSLQTANYIFSPFKGGETIYYRTVNTKNSWFLFTRFDTIIRVASGTFSLDVVDIDDETDTTRIREGRFDVLF